MHNQIWISPCNSSFTITFVVQNLVEFVELGIFTKHQTLALVGRRPGICINDWTFIYCSCHRVDVVFSWVVCVQTGLEPVSVFPFLCLASPAKQQPNVHVVCCKQLLTQCALHSYGAQVCGLTLDTPSALCKQSTIENKIYLTTKKRTIPKMIRIIRGTRTPTRTTVKLELAEMSQNRLNCCPYIMRFEKKKSCFCADWSCNYLIYSNKGWRCCTPKNICLPKHTTTEKNVLLWVSM